MDTTGIFGDHIMGGGNTIGMLQILMLERIEPTSSNFMPITEVPHRTKSWRNLGSETGATTRGTFSVLLLLCSMGWSWTHVLQPKIVGST